MMVYGARLWLSLATTFVSLLAVEARSFHQHVKRQLPTNPNDVTTIVNPLGNNVRYTQPGQLGICETTPGVRSYAGYIDLSTKAHVYFWFFEARENATEAPLTLWRE